MCLFFPEPQCTLFIFCHSERGWGFPGDAVVKKKKKIHLQCKRWRLNTWVRKIPWRRKWQPTPAFLPGKSHGQKSLAGLGCRRVRHDLATKQQTTDVSRENSLLRGKVWGSQWNIKCLGNRGGKKLSQKSQGQKKNRAKKKVLPNTSSPHETIPFIRRLLVAKLFAFQDSVNN